MGLASIAIAGIGRTTPVRRSPKSLRALCIEAVQAAITDAGLEASDIDGVVTDGTIMPATVPRDFIAAHFRIDRRFDAGTSFGGAGSACGPQLAQLAIGSGLAKAVVYYFGVDWGTRASGPYGFNAQPTYFGMWTKRYRHEYGLEGRDLAHIAVTQRRNALLHPDSQMKTPMTQDDYFAARVIADPLRVPDCCLITDGACAFVMTSLERARDLPHPPVTVLGTGFGSESAGGDDVFTQPHALLRIAGAKTACAQALHQAGIAITDVDFAQIYDCFSISCLIQLEELGFCPRGEAAAFIRERGIGIEGGLPVNTHGGLLSHSYLLGVEHVLEAVRQLRRAAGPAQVGNANVGLVGLWSTPDYGVLILGRDGA